MTYARFHLLLLVPMLVGILWLARRRIGARHLLFLAGFSCIVVGWTAPWDNAAVARGLWSFDPARVSGIWIGRLPIEEFAFFLLQTWITAFWIVHRLART